MAARHRTKYLVSLVGICALLVYQNCAQPPKATTSSSSRSVEDSLPFAFKAKIDTVAYMSCMDVAQNVQPRAYFTFRAGAFGVDGTSGVALTEEFLDATKFYTPTDRALAAGRAGASAGARLNLSIRNPDNYALWPDTALRPGYEIDSFLPGLGSSEIAGPLAALTNGKMMNYFPGKSEHRLTEASLRFYESRSMAEQSRNLLGGNLAVLVAGYSKSSDEADDSLAGPGLPGALYGHSFKLGFALGDNIYRTDFQSGPPRALSSLYEKDLLLGLPTNSNWECTSFMIVRAEDLATLPAGTCNATIDRSTAADAPKLRAIRRVLPVGDWHVDMANRCVVQKRTADYCYSGTKFQGQPRTIRYTATTCDQNDLSLSGEACPHYVSVCVRL